MKQSSKKRSKRRSLLNVKKMVKILDDKSKIEMSVISKDITKILLKPEGINENFEFVLNEKTKSIYMKPRKGKLVKVAIISEMGKQSSVKINKQVSSIKLKNTKKFKKSIVDQSVMEWGKFGQIMAYFGAAIATIGSLAWGSGHVLDKIGDNAPKIEKTLDKTNWMILNVNVFKSLGIIGKYL